MLATRSRSEIANETADDERPPCGRCARICNWFADLFRWTNKDLRETNRRLAANHDAYMAKARENSLKLTGRPRI
jgi:hypothetical protein